MSVVEVLNDKVAQELLNSRELAQLAYTWTDGTPRSVPIWFHWDGKEVVMATDPAYPKVKALEARPAVTVTVNTNTWPYHLLIIRGTATLERMSTVVPEYALAAERYRGPEQGRAWVQQAAGLAKEWVRIAITPQEARIIDFETRWPSVIARAMAAERA